MQNVSLNHAGESLDYAVAGHFIEACDCTVICPCWVDEDPAQGSCTGLVAWQLGQGSVINGTDVGGLRVVSVSTHGGNRRDAGQTATVLFIDSTATEEQLELLITAFSGEAPGPLGELAAVSGTVLRAMAAVIGLEQEPNGPWRVRINPTDRPDATIVSADGRPQVFQDQPDPLVLRHTALSTELGIEPGADVTAHAGGTFHVNVGELPGATIDADGRSGMSGAFSYTSGSPAPAGRLSTR